VDAATITVHVPGQYDSRYPYRSGINTGLSICVLSCNSRSELTVGCERGWVKSLDLIGERKSRHWRDSRGTEVRVETPNTQQGSAYTHVDDREWYICSRSDDSNCGRLRPVLFLLRTVMVRV
jgi:hypothetical protein